MTVSEPTGSVHQTIPTEDFAALRALVDGLVHYVATTEAVDQDLTAATDLLQANIDALNTTLTASVNQISQTATSNTAAIQSNVAALSQQVERLTSAESSLTQQQTLNTQQEVLLEQVDSLSQLLTAATNEQADDIIEALFNTKISIGGTAVDLRYLLTFEQILKVYRSTFQATSDWAGTEEYELAFSLPGYGHKMTAPGKIYAWPDSQAFDGQADDPWTLIADQTRLPHPDQGPEYVKAFYQVNDAFGIPAVNLEKEVVLRRQSFAGTNIKAYMPYSKQELTYAGGTAALLGLLIATHGETVRNQFFPATPDAPDAVPAAVADDTGTTADANEAPNP